MRFHVEGRGDFAFGEFGPEVDVVEDCQRHLEQKIKSNQFRLPKGVSYEFAGTYENQLRSTKTLMWVLPLALFVIFMILCRLSDSRGSYHDKRQLVSDYSAFHENDDCCNF